MHTTISFDGINWLAVALATILSFVLGALWHSPMLFGKAWKEDGNPKVDKADKGRNMKIFGFSALFHFVAVVGLAVLIGHDSTLLTGLYIGFLVSLAWVFTAIGVTYLFAGRTFRLLLIDAGFYVVYFSLAGLIIGAW